MRWGWLIGAGLLGLAGLSVYLAFQSPAFVAGLTALASAAAWKAIKPVLVKPMTPNDQAAWHKAIRQGNDDEWRRRKSGAPPKG